MVFFQYEHPMHTHGSKRVFCTKVPVRDVTILLANLGQLYSLWNATPCRELPPATDKCFSCEVLDKLEVYSIHNSAGEKMDQYLVATL